MDRAFRTAVAMGFTDVAASRAASSNPARMLGLDAEIGSIEVGKRADLVVLDEGYEVVAVLAGGEVVAGALEPV
jgi:N-acetylglucosamine-6-phosphate deacetylase